MPSSEVEEILCIYHGRAVSCNAIDIGKHCDKCGWNPDVAEARKAKIIEERNRKLNEH